LKGKAYISDGSQSVGFSVWLDVPTGVCCVGTSQWFVTLNLRVCHAEPKAKHLAAADEVILPSPAGFFPFATAQA
jgi:hypothetical protein